jgi:fatty acid desaturase
MRAVRDEDEFNDYDEVRSRVSAPRRERRLAYEIAFGIWLGGIALAATSTVFWLLLGTLMMSNIKFG